MKNTQQLLASLFEGKKEEYDNEGDMAKDQLFTIADAAEEIHDMLEDDTNLPEWAQNKITKAADYLDSVRDYLAAEMVDDDDMEDDEEDDMNESKTLTVQKATDSVAKVLGQKSANSFIAHLKPSTNKSVTWDHVNTALVKQGVKPHHIAKISINALKESVSEDKVNEISKKTLGSYVKKAQRDMGRSASSSMLHKHLAKDGDSTQDKYAKDATKDMVKRRKGIDKAVDRLTKEDVESLLEYPSDLEKMKKVDSYKVGDKIWTKVGGKWLEGVITKPINKIGNYGVKFKAGGKTHSYVSSPDELRLYVENVDYDICPECKCDPCECNNIHEKLSVSDGMGAWITDFKKSDAPQFKGKDEKERRDMAIAAFMSAKRDQKEQVQESTDKDYIEQKLADADINALVKGSTVMVDKADLLKAKVIVKKLGYNYKVMPGLNA
jgi:hypothetical protein